MRLLVTFAQCVCCTGECDEAIAELENLVQELPQQPVAVSGLARALGVGARPVESRRVAVGLRNLSTIVRVPSFFLAFALAWPGNEEEVLRLLEEAYRERFSWLLYLPIEPAFDFLRSEPKFQNLISRLMPRLADQVTQS